MSQRTPRMLVLVAATGVGAAMALFGSMWFGRGQRCSAPMNETVVATASTPTSDAANEASVVCAHATGVSSSSKEGLQRQVADAPAPASRARVGEPIGVDAAARQWEEYAGYAVDERYHLMSDAELERLSARNDAVASQILGINAWQRGEVDRAVEKYEQAVGQGSIAAAMRASLMFDPDVWDLQDAARRFGISAEGDRLKAYVWARVAAYRGDRNAIQAIARNGRHFGAEEIARMELLAMDMYGRFQNQYALIHGGPFINVPGVDPYPSLTEHLIQTLSKPSQEKPKP